jgi:PAS domain S-box-containing protein
MSDRDNKPNLQRDVELLRARVARLEDERVRRKKAERELQESEERYRMLVETMNDGVGVQDEEGTVIYANDKFARMLGYSRQELRGRPSIDLVAEEYRELYREKLAKRVTGDHAPYEVVLVGKDGRRVSVLASPAPILTRDGKRRGSFAVFTDYTARKQAEETLAQERNLLRTLMDSLPDFIYVKDLESRFITTNTAHLQVLGVQSMSEVVGKTDFDFFPPELAEQYYANEQTVMRLGQPLLNKVEQVIDAAKRTRWVMTFKAPLRDHTGAVTGLVGVSRDITELRRAERALRETEDRFRLILENFRDIAFHINLETGQLEYVSPSCVQRFGFTPDEIIALGLKGCLQQVHPEDAEQLVAHEMKMVSERSDKETSRIVEFRARHRDGQYRWLALSRTMVWSDDGRPLAEIGTIRDITESKYAEKAVQAASRMEATSTLAGGIAHRFNNLMVGVLGNAELLQTSFAGNPDADRMLDSIIQCAQQAGELAHQMLAFARGGKYEPRVFNLNQTIDEMLRFEGRSFPPRVRIECHSEPDLWGIVADPLQMKQVVMNLSLNAVEAIPEMGRVVIRTRNVELDEMSVRTCPGLKPGRYVCLSVEDDGRGMSPEIKTRVFEPFFTTKFQGRGLGLAAAYGIVKNHEGHITVESEEGVGATFRVYLPATAAAEPPPKPAPPSARSGETILVVDDEEMVLDVTREILERAGYRVLCARHGREAVELAQSYAGEIHLTLLDMGMPVMGGAEAFPLLILARPKMKVIIATGYELDPAAQAILDAGANTFVHKPFRAHELAVRVRVALDNEI